MIYDLTWTTEAEKEFDHLDHTIQKHAFTQFKKLNKSPQLGQSLGNKGGLDLTGYRKLYFFQKKYRIVYKFYQKEKKVIIFAIGKREDMKVYQDLFTRIGHRSRTK